MSIPRLARNYETGDAALYYASLGWHVFPVWWPVDGRCACGDPSCKHPAKHPLGRLVPRGFLDATTDPAAIRRWWGAAPLANVGVATGRVSRLLVVDADGAAGRDALADLLDRHDDDGEPAVAETGGGGLHLAFALPPGARARSSVGVIAFKTDVRGDGAAFVAPPSVHAAGRAYRWDGWPPAPGRAPGWLLRLVAPPPEPIRVPAHGDDSPIPEGRRNVALTSVAGTLRRAGLTVAAVEAALLAENAARCRPTLAEAEALAIARSVGRYPPGPTVAGAGPRLVVIRNGVEVAP
jgi:putative DNA primase/helicase